MSGIDAGDFGAWLLQARAALRGVAGTRVPCGDCTGCCTSGYSLEVRPTDAKALERMPVGSLHRSRGTSANWTLRPKADGACPMLSCGQCSIYAQRPQTCLDYDCRVFSAAGMQAGGADKAVINRRVQQWCFRFSCEEDQQAHAAIGAAAGFIRTGGSNFPPGSVPQNPLGIAALALRVYPVFLPPGPPALAADTARAITEMAAAFDRGDVP
jgi:hypothetical protein